MEGKNYTISTSVSLLRDRKSTRKHITQDDYFGTTATILDLLSQEPFISDKKILRKNLKSISKELVFLQEEYQIKKRPQV